MQNNFNLNISDFNYELPDEKIALFPIAERDQSKLLIWKDDKITESDFAEIDQAIPENSLLVFNNTRVIHARLFFYRETGARIEIFCLEPHQPADYQLSFQNTGEVAWKCLVGNAKKWKHGFLEQLVDVDGITIILKAEIVEKTGNAYIIRFSWNKPVNFADIIEAAGKIPIPPYLNRQSEESDNTRYQTVYAKIDGSVAAPTAGLHFTEAVMQKLQKKHIDTAELTLHVGAGTFQPVKTDQVSDHEMHAESVVITRNFLQQLSGHAGKLIAVGTTSVRSLESLYWLGTKINTTQKNAHLVVEQWEPYQPRPTHIESKEVLQNLINWMSSNGLEQFTFTTSIIIVPGYQFRFINGMITNFHQPQSTLLLLIATFLGNNWKDIYDYALKNNFRFLSYGDSNIYLK